MRIFRPISLHTMMRPNTLPSFSIRFCSIRRVSILCEEEMRLSRLLRTAIGVVACRCPQATISRPITIMYHSMVALRCRGVFISSTFLEEY